jgi:hypothetical protein
MKSEELKTDNIESAVGRVAQSVQLDGPGIDSRRG